MPFARSGIFACTQILVNRGLLLLSKNDFVSAQENFEQAVAVATVALNAKQKQPQRTDGEISLFSTNKDARFRLWASRYLIPRVVSAPCSNTDDTNAFQGKLPVLMSWSLCIEALVGHFVTDCRALDNATSRAGTVAGQGVNPTSQRLGRWIQMFE